MCFAWERGGTSGWPWCTVIGADQAESQGLSPNAYEKGWLTLGLPLEQPLLGGNKL